MSDYVDRGLRRVGITVSKPTLAIICLVFGILLIILPNLVGYIIGIFLIIQGILLVTDYMETRRQATPKRTVEPPPPPSETPPAPPSTET